MTVLTPCCVARTRVIKSSVASSTIFRSTGALRDMSGEELASSSHTPGEGESAGVDVAQHTMEDDAMQLCNV